MFIQLLKQLWTNPFQTPEHFENFCPEEATLASLQCGFQLWVFPGLNCLSTDRIPMLCFTLFEHQKLGVGTLSRRVCMVTREVLQVDRVLCSHSPEAY